MVNERVGFKDASVREDFFNTAKQLSGGAAWKAFRALFGIGKSQLERYQNGCCLLSCERFEQILSFFSAQKQEHFQNSVFFKSSNWGVVLGGKRTAQLYPEEFAKRRENGLKKIRELEPMKPIELNIPLSVDLCEFIGAVIGDGCIDGHLDKNSNSHYHTFLTGDSLLDNNYLSNHLSSIGKALFTANPRIYFRKGKRAMVLHFFSKNLFTILTKRFGFTAGNKTYTVKIPEEIMGADKKFIFATIRGIFDTDGCIFFDKRKPYAKPYPRITLQTVSKPLFEQLNSFLKEHFSIHVGKISNRNAFFIEIYGHTQLEKWMNLIGFSNKRHLGRYWKGMGKARSEN